MEHGYERDVAPRRKEIRVLAITCVRGNTAVENVAVNVLRILDRADCKAIPVYSGASEPLVAAFDNVDDEPDFHGKDGFNDVEFDAKPNVARIQSEGAVDGIRKIISMNNPREVTLVTLGPLTNVALAFKLDPNIPSMLKEIYMMAGNTEGLGNSSISAEFNFDADPEAAHIVLDKTVCPTYVAPIELCQMHSVLGLDWRQNVLGKIESPMAEFLNSLEQPWFDRPGYGSVWKAWDQLAMMAALEKESIVKSRSCKASVELQGRLTRGQMVIEKRAFAAANAKRNVIVIDKLNEEIFKETLIRTFMFAG